MTQILLRLFAISLLGFVNARAASSSPTPTPPPAQTSSLPASITTGSLSPEQRKSQEIAQALIKRDNLMEESQRMVKELSNFKNQRLERRNLEARIAEKNKKLAELKKKGEGDSIDSLTEEEEVEALKKALGDMPAFDALDAQIAALESEIKRINSEISIQLGTLTGRLSGEQSFRQTNSITFAILIGMVILGFFGLAFRDPVVRGNIFGGEAGIQFVALFSIIIAIILFGISGILEGKELSALLGGLSGYILGRTSSDRSRVGGNAGGGKPGEGNAGGGNAGGAAGGAGGGHAP